MSRSVRVRFAFVVHEPRGVVEGGAFVDVRRAPDAQKRDVHVQPRPSHVVMSRSHVAGSRGERVNRRGHVVMSRSESVPVAFVVHEVKGVVEGRALVDVGHGTDVQKRGVHVDARGDHVVMPRSQPRAPGSWSLGRARAVPSLLRPVDTGGQGRT
jgi:hypothetical protein